MDNSIERIGRQSEQLFNDELYKIYHLLKYLDNVPVSQTPPDAKYNNALWLNSKNNTLYKYDIERQMWVVVFKEKFQLLDQLLNRTEPLNPQYGQLWLNNEVLMYYDGEQFRPVRTVMADEHAINMSFFNNFLMIPQLESIGETEKNTMQFLIPTTEWDKVFIDGTYDDKYKKIHSSCIQYNSDKKDNDISLVHVNPTKLRNIKKRFFKIDSMSGGIDINTKNKELYAFKKPIESDKSKPVGGVLLKKDIDYNIITNEFQYGKPDGVKSTIALSQEITNNYNYLLVIEYEFDEFNTYGTVTKHSSLDTDLYRGYQIVPLVYPFNIYLDGENLKETSFKYNNLDKIVFIDDIDKDYHKDENGNMVLFGEVYEGQKTVELKDHILKLYGQTFENEDNDLINIPPLDDYGNLRPKELIESYEKNTEASQSVKKIIKNADIAVMSVDEKEVGIIRYLIRRDNAISGFISLRYNYIDPIVFVNGQALYEPLGGFKRKDNLIKIPKTHLGATYAVIDGCKDSKTNVLAYGTIGDKYSYTDVHYNPIFLDNEKLVLLGELYEDQLKLHFKNNILYIRGDVIEMDELPEIKRVKVNSAELLVDKNGDLIIDEIIEHDANKKYVNESNEVLYDPKKCEQYHLKIPHEIIGPNDKIVVFIDGLLISKKNIHRDIDDNIYIDGVKKGQTYLILKDNSNILFDFEMKPAISFDTTFNENLIYIDNKLISNDSAILRERLDTKGAVHNEIQKCIENYTENGIEYKSNKIYICDRYNNKWCELNEEEQETVEHVACQYNNAVSSITTYIENFDNAAIYLYNYADAKKNTLNVGEIILNGFNHVYIVKAAKDINRLDKSLLVDKSFIYDHITEKIYIFYDKQFKDITTEPGYIANKNNMLFLMQDTLYAYGEDKILKPVINVNNSNFILSLNYTLYMANNDGEPEDVTDYITNFNLPSILSATYNNQLYAFSQIRTNNNSYRYIEGDLKDQEDIKTIEKYLTINLSSEYYYQPRTNALSVYLAGIRQFDINESEDGMSFSIPELYRGDVVFITEKMFTNRAYTCVRIREDELKPVLGMHNAFEIPPEINKHLYPGHIAIFIDGIRQNRNAFKIINKKVIQFLGDGIEVNNDGSIKNKILIELKDNYNIRETVVKIDSKKHLSNNNICTIPIDDGLDLPRDILNTRDVLLIYINGVLYTSGRLDNGYTIDKTNKKLILTDAPIVQRLEDDDIVTIEWR